MDFDFLRMLFGHFWAGLYNETIMNYGVKRLHTAEDAARRYHLFDDKGKLMLVADHGSPWLPTDSHRRVHFAYSNGQVLATLDLPEGEGRPLHNFSHTSYALILDHAVYAIFNLYQDKEGDRLPFFTIEIEGMTWLAWGQSDSDVLLMLYSEVPFNLMVVNDPLEEAQLDPIGAVTRSFDAYDFTVALPVNLLHHTDLIVLALVFLVDQI